MTDLEKLEKMQEERVVRLTRIARETGRYFKTIDDPFIEANVERAVDENNKADAKYLAMQ